MRIIKINNNFEWLYLCVFFIPLGWFFFKFSVSDQLAGFSDDSGTYLLMAEVFSLFSEAPESFKKSYEHYYLPPAFPFVLSLFNAGNSIYLSHCIVLAQVFASLAAYYYYCKKNLNIFYAYAALIVFISMPGFWIQILKIGAEFQYIFLSITFLIIQHKNHRYFNKNINVAIFSGVLLSFIVLTRSIGYSLFISYVITELLKLKTGNNFKSLLFSTSFFSLILIIWALIKPDKSHTYWDDLFFFLNGNAPLTDLSSIVLLNISAIYQGIISNISLTVIDVNNFSKTLGGLIILFSSIGWLIRINKIDSIYLFVYLSVLSIWPYPYEMDRFVFPILPIIIFNIFVAINYFSVSLKQKVSFSILYALIILLLVLPSLQHVINRYNLGQDQYGENISSIAELYEIKNESEAKIKSLIIKKNIENIKLINLYVENEDRLLSIKPHLITYLSGVYSEDLPRINGELSNENIKLWLNYIFNTQATHLLLLPVQLAPGYNELEIMPLISGVTEKVFSYGYIVDGKQKPTIAILRLLKK